MLLFQEVVVTVHWLAKEVPALLSEVRGHPLAKHGLEAACWDALAKKNGLSLAEAFAAHLPSGHQSRGYAKVGVSIGIQPTIEATLQIIAKRLGSWNSVFNAAYGLSCFVAIRFLFRSSHCL